MASPLLISLSFLCDECFADPQTGEAPGVTRSRNVRSRCRCSMCPAIHINSRSWLRSSSTHEPSDPPPRVVICTPIQSFGSGRVRATDSRRTGQARGIAPFSLIVEIRTVRKQEMFHRHLPRKTDAPRGEASGRRRGKNMPRSLNLGPQWKGLSPSEQSSRTRSAQVPVVLSGQLRDKRPS